MRVLFCWPNASGTYGVKPMGISLLAAVLRRAGPQVDLFDATFYDTGGADYNDDLTKHGYFKEADLSAFDLTRTGSWRNGLVSKMRKFDPDVLAVSALTDEMPLALEMVISADRVKPFMHIIAGNKGPTMDPGFLAADVNLVVQGEAVGSIEHILKASGELPPSGYFQDLDSLPYLHWDFFDDRQFIRVYDGKVYRGGDHMIGWGCQNSCTYCINESWRELHGGREGFMRMYSVDRIVEELAWLKKRWGLGFWKFHDEDFLLKPMPYLKQLSERYAKDVGLPFVCMAHPRSITKKKVALLRKMGCVSVSMGIEAGSPSMRERLGRRDKPEHVCRAVKLLDEARIRVSAFNMIGLPGETPETLRATIELNREAGVKHPNVSFFLPLPGTKLYDFCVSNRYYTPGKAIKTDEPALGLPGITREQLMWFYENFANLVRMPQEEYDEAMHPLPDARD